MRRMLETFLDPSIEITKTNFRKSLSIIDKWLDSCGEDEYTKWWTYYVK